MSEYGSDDGGYGVDDYGAGAVTMPAGTPYVPEIVSRLEIPVMPPRTRKASSLRGLGDFTRSGTCSILALSRILWRFFNEVATGTTVQSLGTLNVFRAAYNSHRGDFASGFSSAAQALLPATITAAEWSTPVRQSAAIVLSGALGNGHPALRALDSIPPAMSGITAWLTSFRNALDPADVESLRVYTEIPIVTGTAPDVALARAVVDDLRMCGASITPQASPPPPPVPPRVNTGTTPTASGGGSSAGGGISPIQRSAIGVPSGIGSLLVVGLGAVTLYGLYLAVNDKAVGPKSSGLGVYTHPQLAEKAKKAARADAKATKCVLAAAERSTVSFDETAGPKGQSLARALTKIDPATANAIEGVYWSELEALKPGKTCSSS